MAASTFSSAQAAREALAARLAHLRQDAGLTGRELSARCGWHPAKTTRIQKARITPSDADIRAWCTACDAEDHAVDLIATARTVDSMYLDWRRLHRTGMRKTQEDFYGLHQQTEVCRSYVSNVVPGFLQTPAYATALMSAITSFQGTPDDVSEAVAARLARGRLLREVNHRFVILIEEWVLHSRVGCEKTMADQLSYLLAVIPLASVSLGVIPMTARRSVWPLEAFTLYDRGRAVVETLTAEINVTRPRELADYFNAFGELARMAVHGDDARALINSARDSLG
ncbi:helix-turn-helix domain-containing protein [Streptomyces profundus]|uniref:helix-turn-helix domain-containing protein n=1 Tax=Streptomyces profundus TaxID=2867410 RepID=UPI001D16E967|nr:helix-turn-helix transcriptional regulator [Streptomyces sp. MA3_2.13]UED87185.1 helix-turn-helix domain-containing protein [Streptomyces sp. MA3_2.13]